MSAVTPPSSSPALTTSPLSPSTKIRSPLGGIYKGHPCLVCTATSDHAHLGFDICRACAAFFKRTHSSGKRLVCRRGDGKCVIRKHEPFICRSCRYDKCMSLGLGAERQMDIHLPSPVDHKELRPVEMKLDFSAPATPLFQSVIVTPSTSTASPTLSIPIPAPVQIAASPSTIPSNSGILHKIAKAYTECCDRRKINEEALRVSNDYGSAFVQIDETNEKYWVCTLEYNTDAIPMMTVDIIRFMSDAFEQFATLSRRERSLIFKAGSAMFWQLECYHLRTKRKLSDRYCPFGMTNVADTENIEAFLTDDINKSVKKDIATHIRYYWTHPMKSGHPMLKKAKLTDVEYYALLGIIIWSFDAVSLSTIPADIIEMGQGIRDSIFRELNRYYKDELRLDEYATRIGEMMSVSHALREGASLVNEELQLYRLYDLWKEDSFVHKTFYQRG